ncbi:hypothetical protein BDV93DRAFT_607115 [Ceratobasidium sp. AG-I]|nr:hypothetical protein BDV93DRAFT_607115 [Ceratobasidium sp. AG-I]
MCAVAPTELGRPSCVMRWEWQGHRGVTCLPRSSIYIVHPASPTPLTTTHIHTSPRQLLSALRPQHCPVYRLAQLRYSWHCHPDRSRSLQFIPDVRVARAQQLLYLTYSHLRPTGSVLTAQYGLPSFSSRNQFFSRGAARVDEGTTNESSLFRQRCVLGPAIEERRGR